MNKGFTLAEVLITLGIIGVVAALTIPVLIQKYNKTVTETRLKKFYSVMNQAINQSKVYNGETEYWEYYIEEIPDGEGDYIEQNDKTDEVFRKYIGPYLVITGTREFPDVSYSNKKRLLYYFADGSSFAYRPKHNREIEFFPNRADRCLKRPANERFGSCSFLFEFMTTKYSGADWEYITTGQMIPYLYSWDGNKESLYTDTTYGCKDNGTYCTALIRYNGWEIPKDYPRRISF